MMRRRGAPPARRRKVRTEIPARLPRENASPRRRGKIRQSLRDRLPRARRSGRSIKTKTLRKRRALATRKQKPRENSLVRNDVAPRRIRERDDILRPIRNHESSPYDNVSFKNDVFPSRKIPNRSDIYFLDYMHEVNEKYRTLHHDDLFLKNEPRPERRDLRYQDDFSSLRRSTRDKYDRYSRPDSPSRKLVEFDKYERRLRENSAYKKPNSHDLSQYNSHSFPSNSRGERNDRYSHENHSSSRRSTHAEKSRRYEDESFTFKNHAPVPKHRDRHADRPSPTLERTFTKEPSPLRRINSEKYERRKEYPPPPSLSERFSRYNVPSPKYYDKPNSDPYPRRKELDTRREDDRSSRNNLSPRRKYADYPPVRAPLDRHEKYTHPSPARRSAHNDKYERRSESDRHRRPRVSPHRPADKRNRPPSPRRDIHPEKREKYSSDHPRELIYSEKRSDKYYHYLEPSRSEKPPLRKPALPERPDKPDDTKYPPRLDKRDRMLTELAHSSKLESLGRLKQSSRPERILPEQYTRRNAKSSQPALPPPKRKLIKDGKRARKRPRSVLREREKLPTNNNTRIIKFRKPRPKPDKQTFRERLSSQ